MRIKFYYEIRERYLAVTFEPIENAAAYNCIIASIASIAKYNGLDYQMILGNNWNLRYEIGNSSMRIGERINIINQVDIAQRTMKFHGFSWETESFEARYFDADTGCFADYSYPFLVNVDWYDAKWSNFYKKYHFLHTFIIADYNSFNGTYICIDPYFHYSHLDLLKEDLFNCLDSCGRIVLSNFCNNMHTDDYVAVIQEDLLMVNKDNENFNNIKCLANDICTEMDIKSEFDEFKENLQAVPIMNGMRKIAMCRESYACMIDYVFELVNLNYLHDASILIKRSVTLWKTIKAKLLKAYLTNSMKSDRYTIYQILNQIADIEKQAIDIILYSLNGEKI